MKIPLLYGFLIALANAIVTLVMYFAGFHDSPEKMMSARWLGFVIVLAIGGVGLWFAMRDKRAQAPATAEWGYGSALGVGTLTALFAAVFGAVFTYIYFAIINPNMSEILVQTQLTAMQAKNVPQARIDAAEPVMRKMMSPVGVTCIGLLQAFIIGFIEALLVAIAFRKRPVVEGTPPPVAA